VSYKIANLLQFYLVLMSRTVGEEAQLCSVLRGVTDEGYRMFFELVEKQGRAVVRGGVVSLSFMSFLVLDADGS
jgi:conserved oligomeric Golgi complex subunit 6